MKKKNKKSEVHLNACLKRNFVGVIVVMRKEKNLNIKEWMMKKLKKEQCGVWNGIKKSSCGQNVKGRAKVKKKTATRKKKTMKKKKK